MVMAPPRNTPRPQRFRRLDQKPVSPGNTVILNIPNAHILGALEIGLDFAVNDDEDAAISVVDATLGPIPLIRRIQFILDGATIPVSVSGAELDLWGRLDRPGSERLATSSTTSGARWQANLRWEAAQSEVNLNGAILLSNFGTIQVEIEFHDVSSIATSANDTTITGNVEVYGELYRQDSNIGFDDSVMHSLTSFFREIQQPGDIPIDIPRGPALERLIVLAENNGVLTYNLVDSLTWSNTQGDEPYFRPTYMFRAMQKRNYGGENVPITGAYVFDFRRAANRDVIPLGDPVASPAPQVLARISSTPALTNARLYFLREQLARVEQLAA